MSSHTAHIAWQRHGANFLDKRYPRLHQWSFDGGVTVPASSSPAVIRPPLSEVAAVDPEEAFIAALASCHMLWFLAIAAHRGFCVDSYDDDPAGKMAINADGKMAVTAVTLRPKVIFSGERQPSREELDAMHHESHEQCNIANSVKTAVTVEPVTA